MTEDSGALRAILDEQDKAWCDGDAAVFSRRVAADVIFTNVVGLFSVGREPFETQHRHIFATFYKGSALRQVVERISFVRPDVAVVNTLTKVTGFNALPPILPAQDGVLTTRLEQVLERTTEGWQVVSFHNVIVHPQAAATAPPRGA